MYKDQFGILRYTEEEILNFIKRFQNEGTIKTFTQGCCYWFAYILNYRFCSFEPESQIMYNDKENHYACYINNKLYDITGEIPMTSDWVWWNEYQYKGDELVVERLYRDCIDF